MPQGAFSVTHHPGPFPKPWEALTACTRGKGRIESFSVFPGIEVSLHQYQADRVQFCHKAKDSVLEINHCRAGRMGWNMRGAAVYLGPGDLCLHSLGCCADSEMTLPLGWYEGIAVTADLQILARECPALLREAGFAPQALYEKFCAPGKPLGIPSNHEIQGIFAPLYGLKPPMQTPYYKLKALELLLYLQQMEPESQQALTQYGSQQTERIREIRDFLVAHLDQRFTIEFLAKKYLINTSSLKSVFKAVYGMPIASYVKEYRMEQARKLLRETNDSMAVIAQKVGYETQGKFTKAFKEAAQVLPTEYRKQYQG